MVKKAGLAASLAIALAMALALAGRGSSVALDRQVTVGDMTLKVPSKFVEKINDSSTASEMSIYSQYTDQEGKGILVTANNGKYYLQETVKDEVDMHKKTYEQVKGYDIYANEVSSDVVNGAEVTIYEQGYKYKDGKGNEHQSDTHVAYIFGGKAHYTITVYGDGMSIDDVLKTVSF